MTKKTSSIVKLVVILLVAVIGGVLSFCSFNIPGTFYKYNSFASSIKLGLDLKGGIYAVYEAKSDGVKDFETKLSLTQDRLTELLTEKGYDATVTTEGTTNLRVEVPDVSDPSSIFELIGKPCQVVFSIDDEIVMKGKNLITGATARYNAQEGGYEVMLEMTVEGQQQFGNVTGDHIGETMEIYLVYDENYENFPEGATLVTSASINTRINGNATITGSFTAEQAENLASSIESGTFDLVLSLVESSTMPATLGEQALETGLLAGALGLVLVIIFMIVRYRNLGLVAFISLVVYAEAMLFLLSAIPWVQLTLAGIAGIILSLGMAVDGNVILYERIKEEYAAGKSVSAAFHVGYSKTVWPILDGNVTTILAAVILMILGTGTIKGFGLTLLVGIILSLAMSLGLNYLLVGAFVELDPDHPNRFSLKRKDGFKEMQPALATASVADESVAVEETEADVVEEAPVEEIVSADAQEEEGGNE